MHRILFDWRGIRIYSYPAMLYLGLVVGMTVGNFLANLDGLDSARVLIAMLSLTVVGLVGARLLHLAIHWEIYRREPERIWRRSEGGASQLGGLGLMVPVSVPLLGALGLPVARFWDVAIFTMLIGMIFTKTGCLLNGCCGGRPSDSWFALNLPDHRGIWRRRIPSQPLEAALAALLLLAAVGMWPHRPYAGAVFLAVVGTYALGRIGLQATREIQERLGAVNVQQTLVAVIGVLALVGLLLGWFGDQ